MQSDRMIQAVSAHAEGEVGIVITGGAPLPPGRTMWERRKFLEEDGSLRRFLLNEPRGHVATHYDLLVPPTQDGADAAFLIMEPEHTPPMSGSNTICVATVCLETGLIPMTGDETELVLEVPAGLLPVRADTRGGRVNSVTFQNVPAFVDRLDAKLEVPGHGTLDVSTAWGGDSFVLIDAAPLGFAITPDEAADLSTLGANVTRAANDQLGFRHPTLDWSHVSFCQFTGPLERQGTDLTGRNAVVIDPGRLDRSPCGTGCSARMAVLAARGQMSPEDRYIARSAIGGRFDATFEPGPEGTILPSITGRAWITGTHQFMRDPADPWPEGYRLTDTWPRGA